MTPTNYTNRRCRWRRDNSICVRIEDPGGPVVFVRWADDSTSSCLRDELEVLG